MKTAKPNNDFEESILKNIEEYGYQVNVINDPDYVDPLFVYSVGLWKTYAHAEIIIIGLHHTPARKIIQVIADGLKLGGDHLKDEDIREDLLPGFECIVFAASPDLFKEYLLSAVWLYEGTEFPVFQIVFQDENNLWPWDEGASEEFTGNQPLLIK